MAKYRAVTAIKYSDPADENAVVREILAGEIVAGLAKEAMKELWEAGALEKVDESEPVPPAE